MTVPRSTIHTLTYKLFYRKSLKTSRQFASNEQVNNIFENRLDSQFYDDEYCAGDVLRKASILKFKCRMVLILVSIFVTALSGGSSIQSY